MKVIFAAIIYGLLPLSLMAQVGKKGEEKIAPKSTAPAKKTTAAPARRRSSAPRTNRTSNAEDRAATERTFWESIRDSTKPEDFRAYLRDYPNGKFVSLARNKLEALETTAETTAAPPVRQPPGLANTIWAEETQYANYSRFVLSEKTVIWEVRVRDGKGDNIAVIYQGEWAQDGIRLTMTFPKQSGKLGGIIPYDTEFIGTLTGDLIEATSTSEFESKLFKLRRVQ